jgi:hypothetical protein
MELVHQELADAYLVRLWAWVMKHAPGGDLTPTIAFDKGGVAIDAPKLEE